jgi:hypothetical protein
LKGKITETPKELALRMDEWYKIGRNTESVIVPYSEIMLEKSLKTFTQVADSINVIGANTCNWDNCRKYNTLCEYFKLCTASDLDFVIKRDYVREERYK